MPRRRLHIQVTYSDDAPRPPWWLAVVVVAIVTLAIIDRVW